MRIFHQRRQPSIKHWLSHFLLCLWFGSLLLLTGCTSSGFLLGVSMIVCELDNSCDEEEEDSNNNSSRSSVMNVATALSQINTIDATEPSQSDPRSLTMLMLCSPDKINVMEGEMDYDILLSRQQEGPKTPSLQQMTTTMINASHLLDGEIYLTNMTIAEADQLEQQAYPTNSTLDDFINQDGIYLVWTNATLCIHQQPEAELSIWRHYEYALELLSLSCSLSSPTSHTIQNLTMDIDMEMDVAMAIKSQRIDCPLAATNTTD